MPLNLLKNYNALLDLIGLSTHNCRFSLKRIFDRDIANNNNFKFRLKQITPTPQDGEILMETLFRHLTTVVVDEKTKHREFDLHRSVRLHWIKHHIQERKRSNMMYFSVKEKKGIRTYIYDIDEKYVIVLEPKFNNTIYYLLTAYNLRGKDAKRDKMMRKYRRKLETVV